ncbi:GNAT family N-acetyltransferase [Thermasporomyces composti]|jgi:RimJ/RimL family protein N-acetyltransferase|uniref:Lysine N-acyltransferase MbtK n=1 Tax=Thermasporomyces composti TaxID=696763 RepID=A0A3D9VAM7_THECX|nr:GNAT family N-acetyltransferase [Thermasporomyces composti]REF37210.1 RimJ/RimL family protein N-acetyltransferase [Thermasporomyces composti]
MTDSPSDAVGGIVFTRHDPALGDFALRRLDLDTDAALVHQWVTHPKAVFWMMQDADLATVTAAYRAVLDDPHRDAFLGLANDTPAFLVERYDPAHVELVGLYDAQEGDVGMHVLCAPTDVPVHGFTRAVFRTVMEFLFADPATRRVVVEPDVRNTAVHKLNAYVGFQVVGVVTKPEKKALLSVCTREQYLATLEGADT